LKRLILVLGWFLATAHSVTAQRAIPHGMVESGMLSFDGSATTGDFVGSTESMTGELVGGPDLTTARGWVEAPVQTLKTGNGKRDRDLNKSMESEQFPTMRFDLSDVLPGAGSGDSVDVTLHGTLTIHGIAREVSLPASLNFLAGSIRVRCQFPLNLKDYRIGGLTKMLGVLRMSPSILVHVDLQFRLEEELPPTP